MANNIVVEYYMIIINQLIEKFLHLTFKVKLLEAWELLCLYTPTANSPITFLLFWFLPLTIFPRGGGHLGVYL